MSVSDTKILPVPHDISPDAADVAKQELLDLAKGCDVGVNYQLEATGSPLTPLSLQLAHAFYHKLLHDKVTASLDEILADNLTSVAPAEEVSAA